jgi:hypothetical protein
MLETVIWPSRLVVDGVNSLWRMMKISQKVPLEFEAKLIGA